jgi:toxin ParE1/3/4
MSLPLILRPEAQADLLAIRDVYEQQRAGLGTAFGDAVDDLLLRIRAMPQLYAVAHKDVRRAKVRRFPYVAYYRVLADRIEVFAVLHGSRDPQIWQSRV